MPGPKAFTRWRPCQLTRPGRTELAAKGITGCGAGCRAPAPACRRQGRRRQGQGRVAHAPHCRRNLAVAGGRDGDDAEADAGEPARLILPGLGYVAGRDQERLRRLRCRTPRVQQRNRPRPPARPLPAAGCPVPPRRLPQERLRPQAAPGVPRPHPQVPAGEHFWSPSYFAASRGGAPLAIIKHGITPSRHQ